MKIINNPVTMSEPRNRSIETTKISAILYLLLGNSPLCSLPVSVEGAGWCMGNGITDDGDDDEDVDCAIDDLAGSLGAKVEECVEVRFRLQTPLEPL